MTTTKPEYFILCLDTASNEAVFWRPGGAGYTMQLDRAGRFTYEQAISIIDIRGKEIMVPCELAEGLCVRICDRLALIEAGRNLIEAAQQSDTKNTPRK